MPYTIVSGDTLGRIAARVGVSTQTLLDLNPQLTDSRHRGGDLIFPGETVNLPGDTTSGGGGDTSSGPPPVVAPTPSEPTDPDWQRLAFRFQQLYGFRPRVDRSTKYVLDHIARKDAAWAAAATEFFSLYGEYPRGDRDAAWVMRKVREATPDPVPDPSPPVPEPDPETTPPAPDPIDYQARAAALFPWLPSGLRQIFVQHWTEHGDATLALAETRADPSYDDHFPGIKREDGSLRMTEQEWFATRGAYSRLVGEFGLNPDIFESMFTAWMEGDVSPSEVAGRLGGAYEQIITNIPQVKEFYARTYGLDLTDQAVFASFLDPSIGEAILTRRISVAQVAGEGLARGFDVGSPFAERLASAGIDQSRARAFFSEADAQLPTLDVLARRFRDPDQSFDVEEFAEATVFGSAGQARRVRRLLAAEASLFSDQVGAVAMSDELAVTGLTAR